MTLDTNSNIAVLSDSYPSLIWAVSPWHSWGDRNYNRVHAAVISSNRIADIVLDVIDGWFPLYAAHTALDFTGDVTKTDISLAFKFTVDNPEAITDYDTLRSELQTDKYMQGLPPESPTADRVFELKAEFQNRRAEFEQPTLYRRVEPDHDTLTLIDDDLPHPIDEWGYSLPMDALQREITDVLDDQLSWSTRRRHENALKYFCWGVSSDPTSVWLGHPPDPEPPLREKVRGQLPLLGN